MTSGHSIVQSVTEKKLTYLSTERLESLAYEVEKLRSKSDRDLIVEFGVAKGGSGILMASLMGPRLAYRGFDVFEQIPPPDERDGSEALQRFNVIQSGASEGIGGDTYYGYENDLLASVQDQFAAFNVPCDGSRVELIQGLFQETVHFAEDDVVALVHIDCDWYEPTLFCLNAVASRIPKWGTIIVDDFSDWPGCRKATHEFLAANTNFLLREVQPHAIIRRFT